MKKIRIGSGAGYAGDRIEPALDLIKYGNLDYIGFECLAERTIALANARKLKNPEEGYDELLKARMERILPLLKDHPVKIISNMGAANPLSAVKIISKMAGDLNIPLKIAAVLGDDIMGSINSYKHYKIIETGGELGSLKDNIVSANAYLGVEGILEALQNGADIVITGRVADPSLFLAPLMYEFGWTPNDFCMKGKGILAGHLLECAAQVTGGYFADPGYKDVPDLWNIGFPIAEVSEDGDIVITKLDGSGGIVSEATCKEQMLYEIHDPSNYFTPDGIADFTGVTVHEESKDRIQLTGASGKQDNGMYKVSVGYLDGYIGEGQISYGGSNALKRAVLAGEIINHRLSSVQEDILETRTDYLGVNSLYKSIHSNMEANNSEVRLRVAVRTKKENIAKLLGNEVEALYLNGPYGGGGAEKSVRQVLAIASVLIDKKDISHKVVYEVSK